MDSSLALNFISRVVNLDGVDRLVADQRNAQAWIALSSLMRRTWFKRRWVVQEIALAVRATLYCGDAHIDWSDFACAVSFFEAMESESHKISKSVVGAIRLAKASSNLFRKSKDGQVLERLFSLETLISTFSDFQTSRPHDTIYSVLNLARDVPTSAAKSDTERLVKLATPRFTQAAEGTRFMVDYNKPFIEVCKEFLRLTIKTDGFLDIICRPWVPEEGISETERPSWLLTTSKAAWRMRPDGIYSRANADTLVGPPDLGKRNYNASKSFKVTDKWKFGEGQKVRSMYVEGFVIDSIKERKPCAADGIIFREWLSAGGWTDMSALPPDEFWRTLVADRGRNGVNPPMLYPRACRAALKQSVKGGHVHTDTLIRDVRSTSVANFLRRVQEVIWMRRLIITERNTLGLAPEMSKKRDLICILYGCSVPVALRRMVDPVTDEEYFTFIGECYVHGLMDGEAFALATSRSDNGMIANKVFELR